MDDYLYLKKHREVWREKPVLQRIYGEQYYQRLLAHHSKNSKTLEIGSGPGFIQEFAPDVIRTDILVTEWINCGVDAHQLPFGDATFDNVLALDVIHHLQSPIALLKEVTRVLKPNGYVILVEPWITPFSRFIYTYLHQERCDLEQKPWIKEQQQFSDNKQAFDGNAAIPYLLFEKGHEYIQQELPNLKLISLERMSSLTYLLSLGFKRGNFLPEFAYPALYGLEEFTRPMWARFAALRATITLQKIG